MLESTKKYFDITGKDPDQIGPLKLAYLGDAVYELLIRTILMDERDRSVKKMNKSGRYILYIPSDLGYGSAGSGTEGYANYIPPYSTLIFDVTLIDVY